MVVTVDAIPVDVVVVAVVSEQSDLRGGITDPRLQPVLPVDIVVAVVVAVLVVAERDFTLWFVDDEQRGGGAVNVRDARRSLARGCSLDIVVSRLSTRRERFLPPLLRLLLTRTRSPRGRRPVRSLRIAVALFRVTHRDSLGIRAGGRGTTLVFEGHIDSSNGQHWLRRRRRRFQLLCRSDDTVLPLLIFAGRVPAPLIRETADRVLSARVSSDLQSALRPLILGQAVALPHDVHRDVARGIKLLRAGSGSVMLIVGRGSFATILRPAVLNTSVRISRLVAIPLISLVGQALVLAILYALLDRLVYNRTSAR